MHGTGQNTKSLDAFIFGARNVHIRSIMVGKTGAKNRRQKVESIYGAGFWSVCHGLVSKVT